MRPALTFTLLLLASCAHEGARFVPRADAVEIEDLASELVATIGTSPDERAAGEAWLAYLRLHPELDAAGDLSAARPEAMGKAARLALPQLAATAGSFGEEAREVAQAVSTLFGRSLRARITLAVQRDDAPTATLDGPRIVLNARSPAASEAPRRRALLAQALCLSWLEPTPSLGPLASALYRRTLAAAAARGVSPSARAAWLAQRSEEDVTKLEARLALTAREALTGLDSASPAQAERFFGKPAVPDPLVPQGAGPHLAVELAAKLVEGLGTSERVLRLAPGEFRREAARALQRMASSP